MANNFSSIVKRMEADGLVSPTPMLEQAWLHRCAMVYSGMGNIIELGTHYGANAIVLAQAVKDARHDSRVISIEILPETVDKAKKNIAKYGFAGVIEIIQGNDAEVLCDFPDEHAGMVYVDSLHSYPHVSDVLLSLPWKVVFGGLVCGHDYAPWEPGVVEAVSEWRDNMLNLVTGFSVYETTWWALRCCQS